MSWLGTLSKAFTAMRHSGRTPFFSGLLKRTRFNYRKEVGDGLDSSVVTAPALWIARALPEATLSVSTRKRDGSVDEQPDHPMLALVQKGSPVQEWSYGYDVLDADQQQREGRPVQVLKKLKVDEISPVVRGAGVGTGTISIKSAELKQANFAPLIASLGELAEAIDEKPDRLSATGLKQLAEIHVSLGKALELAARPLDPRTEEKLAAEHEREIQAALGGWLEWLSRGNVRA